MSIKINVVEVIPDGVNISGKGNISIVANGDKSGIFVEDHKITKEEVQEFIKNIPPEFEIKNDR